MTLLKTQNDCMKIVFEINKCYSLIDILNKIVKKYKNSTHRTIGMKPIEVNKENEKIVRNGIQNKEFQNLKLEIVLELQIRKIPFK